jgi:hypothetical protein
MAAQVIRDAKKDPNLPRFGDRARENIQDRLVVLRADKELFLEIDALATKKGMPREKEVATANVREIEGSIEDVDYGVRPVASCVRPYLA